VSVVKLPALVVGLSLVAVSPELSPSVSSPEVPVSPVVGVDAVGAVSPVVVVSGVPVVSVALSLAAPSSLGLHARAGTTQRRKNEVTSERE
jgi:hypothetical protein